MPGPADPVEDDDVMRAGFGDAARRSLPGAPRAPALGPEEYLGQPTRGHTSIKGHMSTKP
jgi:hypothetical protein